jgi:hypothetical protein
LRSAKGSLVVSNTASDSGSGAKSMENSSGSAPAPSGTGAVMQQVTRGSDVVMVLVAVGLSLP